MDKYFPVFFLPKSMQEKNNQEVKGVIIEALPNTAFKVRLESGKEIIATLSGKMRKNYIRVLPGDQILVEMTPYDLERGRIIWKAR